VGNSFNYFNNLVLELNNRLKEKNIVKEFYYHIPNQHIHLSINHKYPTIDAIFKIDISDWSKNSEKIQKILKPKGVEKEDIELCCITLDNHWKKILDLIKNNYNNNNTSIVISNSSDPYDQSINNLSKKNNKNEFREEEQACNQKQGSQTQKDIPTLSVLEAIRVSEGLKKVIGRIVGRSTNFKVITRSEWKCQNFECQNRGILNFHPPILYMLKNLDNTTGTDPSCRLCKSFGSLDVIHEYQNAKIIQLDDIDTIEEKFDRLDVILYDDASKYIIDGEIVEIEGDLRTQKLIGSRNSSRGSKMTNVLHSNKRIIYKNRKKIDIFEKDVKIFYNWKRICQDAYKKEIELVNKCKRCAQTIIPMTFEQRITAMFAPNVYGHADKKMGILRSIVGGSKTKNGTENGRRGRIHTLMIGDPGTAKTSLAAESIKLDQNSRIVDATGASGKSLVGIVDKENDSLMVKYGVVVAAKNSHIVINEAGSLSHEDQSHLIGIAEEGTTSLDKWGEHISIDAPTTLILTANPIGTKWESSKMSKDKMVVIRQNLMDRIDQIYGFFDAQTEEEMEEFVNEMDKNSRRRPHNSNFLIKFLQYAKTIEPKLTEITKYRLNRFWINAKIKGMAGNRTFFSIKRIAEAQAKLNLSWQVDDNIARKTMQSLQLMYNQYGTTIEQIQNPRDLTVEVFYEILKENKGINHSIRELCKKASEKNKQINKYLKKNWELSQNKELRTILEMLEQKENIKIIKLKPRVLVYSIETSLNPIESKRDIDNSIYDQCDSYDQSSNNTLEENENNDNYCYDSNLQSYRSYRSDSNEEYITENDKVEYIW